MYEKSLYGGHFEKQNGGYFLFLKKMEHQFSDSEHSKVSKNVEILKLTDTPHETFILNILNLTN